MIFQITGYPRSGTAWLTTMFNLTPDVTAFHELAMTNERWRQTLQETVNAGQIVGDIGTYQYFPKAVIANSRKVFINQDSLEAQGRVEKATGTWIHNAHLDWKRMSDNWRSEWNPMVVEYKDLFKIETLERIWKFCIPWREAIPDSRGRICNVFPYQKVEQLLKFNIQLHEPAKALANPGAITRLAELL